MEAISVSDIRTAAKLIVAGGGRLLVGRVGTGSAVRWLFLREPWIEDVHVAIQNGHANFSHIAVEKATALLDDIATGRTQIW
jgi:hypothetical protein